MAPNNAAGMELDPKYGAHNHYLTPWYLSVTILMEVLSSDHYDFPIISPNNQSGHPGHTTKEQDAAVHQFRMLLEQAGYTKNLDTLTLLRFLRARKFDVQAAKKMCGSSLRLR